MKPNVLLIVHEATRLDVVESILARPECADGAWARMKRHGVFSRRMFASAGWTVPAVMSILTGRHPSEHGVLAGGQETISEGITSLPVWLDQLGWRTHAIVSTAYLGALPAFTNQFSEVERLDERAASFRQLLGSPVGWMGDWDYAKSLMWNLVNGRDKRTMYMTRRARRRIAQMDRSDRPWFLLMHLQAPHEVYNPPRRWRPSVDPRVRTGLALLETHGAGWEYMAGTLDLAPEVMASYRAMYEAEARYVDWRIGCLLHRLEVDGHLENTVVVMVADHGDHLGEAGLLYHHFSLRNEIIRVPFAVLCPGSDGPTFQHQSLLSHVHIAGIVTDAVGSPSAAGWRVVEEAQPRAVFSEYERPQTSLTKLQAAAAPGADLTPFECAMRSAVTPRDEKLVVASDGRHWLTTVREDYGGPKSPGCSGSDLPEEELKTLLSRELGEFTSSATSL